MATPPAPETALYSDSPEAYVVPDKSIFTKRRISHEEAQQVADRLIASHFRKTDRENARISIPANPERDDDLLITAYIKQQAALATTTLLSDEVAFVASESRRKAIESDFHSGAFQTRDLMRVPFVWLLHELELANEKRATLHAACAAEIAGLKFSQEKMEKLCSQLARETIDLEAGLARLTMGYEILKASKLNGTGPYDAHRIIETALHGGGMPAMPRALGSESP